MKKLMIIIIAFLEVLFAMGNDDKSNPLKYM